MLYLKQKLKALTKSNLFIKILSAIIYMYINIVYFTSKKYFIFSKKFNKSKHIKGSFIYAFWHNRLSLAFYLAPPKTKINILISEHKDGKIIAQTSRLFGRKIITGSSNKISIKSLRNIIKCLVNKESLAITPDGPRGPVYEINSNIAKIAQKTSTTIIPISFSCKKKKIMNSWDNFIVPLPFNQIYLIYGNPIDPTQNNIEKLLKKELDRLHKEYDSKFNENVSI